MNVSLLPAASISAGTYTLLSATSPLSLSGITYNTPSGSRQSFTIDTSSNPNDIFLDVGAGSPANLKWNYAAGTPHDGSTWDITTNNNWQAIGGVTGGSPNQFYQLDNVLFDDTSNETHSVTLNDTVEPTSVTVNTGSSYTFTGGGAIGGTGGLTLQGGGTLNLNNSGGNNYSGTTAIQNGTLAVGQFNALPTNSVVTLGDNSNHNGVLDLNGNSPTVGGLSTVGSGTGNIVGNSSTSSQSTLNYSGTGSQTFAGSIRDTIGSGNQNVSLNLNSGTLILSGSNTYTGQTQIDSGATLQLNAGGSLSSATQISDNSALIYNTGASTTVANNISGSGSVEISSGTVIFTNGNSYNTTQIDNGATLQIDNGGTSGTLGSGNVTNNGSLVFKRSDASPVTISNVIGGSGSISQLGSGTIVLSSSNNFTGGVTIGDGVNPSTLQFNSVFAFGPSGAITVMNGSTLDFSVASAANLQLTTRPVSIAGTGVGNEGAIYNSATQQENAFQNLILTADATINNDSSAGNPFSPTFTGRVDIRSTSAANLAQLNLNGHTLTKNGGGQFTLHNVNVTDGSIIVNAGLLAIEDNTTITDFHDGNSITFNDGSTMAIFEDAGTAVNVTRPINFNGPSSGVTVAVTSSGTVTFGGNIQVDGLVLFTYQNGANAATTVQLSGNITEVPSSHSTITLFKTTGQNAPTVILSGNNNYTGGININDGTLRLASATAMPGGTSISFANTGGSGTFDLGGFNATVSGLSVGSGTATIGNSSTTSAATLIYSGTGVNTFSGTIQDVLGTGTQTTGVSVAAETLILSGNSNSYSGGTTVSGGTLQMGSSSALGSTSGTLTVNSSGTLDLNTNSLGVGALNGTGGSITNTAGGNPTLTVGNGDANGSSATSIANGTGGGITALVKTGTGIQTLSGNSSYTGGTTINDGTLIVSHVHGLGQSTTNGLTINNTALVQLTTGTGAGPVVLPSVSIAGNASPTGTLDIGSSKMVLTNTSYASAVSAYTVARAQVTNALDGFAWDQPGITSSTVANDINNLGVPTSVAVILNNSSGTAGGGAGDASDELFYSDGSGSPTTNPNGLPQFAGTSVDQNSVLFKYTYIGDSNLDGMVDSTDFGLFLAGYNDPGTAASLGWAVGDYDYSGTVDSTDFGLFLAGYNYYASNPVPLAGAGGVQPVPEAESVYLMVSAIVGLIVLSLSKHRK